MPDTATLTNPKHLAKLAKGHKAAHDKLHKHLAATPALAEAERKAHDEYLAAQGNGPAPVANSNGHSASTEASDDN